MRASSPPPPRSARRALAASAWASASCRSSSSATSLSAPPEGQLDAAAEARLSPSLHEHMFANGGGRSGETPRKTADGATPTRRSSAAPPDGSPGVLAADGGLSAEPAVNFGTVEAGMSTFWPGLRGFTPCRAARCCTLNLPKPVKVTSPPPLSVSEIVPSTASTAFPASRLDSPVRLATCSMNSLFVTTNSLHWCRNSTNPADASRDLGRRQTA